MSQSLANRDSIISQLQQLKTKLLLLIDECHINTMTKVIQQFDEAFRIGFSATPAWKWGKHLPKLYNFLVEGPQVDELIQSGYLSPYKYFARVSASLNELKIKNGEFTEESQEFAFEKQQVYEGLFDDLKKIKYTKCMIFTASIRHAENVHQQLTEAGFNSCRYHSQLTNGAYELAKFTDLNQSDICVSVAALNKGWDYKPIDLVVFLKATTSLPSFLQMLGRASRTIKGKTHFTVLDYAENYKRHGLYDWDRDWQELWKEGKRKREGVAPIKMCPECEYIMHASAPKCPNCGYVFPAKQQTPEESKLIEITESYNQLVGKKISQLTPQELSIYVKFKNKRPYGARIARSHGIDFLLQYAQCMGYKPGWANHQDTNNPVDYYDITLK